MGRQILTASETRALEARANECGVSFFQLMENAGAAAANWLLEHTYCAHFCILCGKGNNAGDGYGIAEILSKHGKTVRVIQLFGEPNTEDASIMMTRARRVGVPMLEYPAKALFETQTDCIVDAVYGIGFHGELDEGTRECFRAVQKASALRVAVDLPSGVICDTSEVADDAFQADVTLTFSAYKPAQMHFPSESYCGKVFCLPIGIPSTVSDSQTCEEWLISEADVKGILPMRPIESHKGTFGKALCVCGSYGMAGAAALAATGALRCGAGLVQVAMPESIYPILAERLAEPIMLPLPEEIPGVLHQNSVEKVCSASKNANAVLFGCGVGIGAMQEALLLALLKKQNHPLVIDADGINLLAKHKDEWRTASCPTVITPHPGEMARLCACTVTEVNRNRVALARKMAQDYSAVVVLKGHHTVIAAQDGTVWVNPTGNAGMAKGGSGDLLAGMLVSLLAQGCTPIHAAIAAVWLHGKAGDLCAETLSQTAMLPSDVAAFLPKLFLNIERREAMDIEQNPPMLHGNAVDDGL